MIETSKGIFKFNSCGGGNGFEVGSINECCIGFFLLKENEEREYFTSKEDIKAIWDFKKI